MTYKADKRLYLNADRSKVVEEGDSEAAYLFAGVGDEVSDADAKKFGLHKRSEKSEAETKQVESPPENKARTMRSDKD